MLYCKTRHYASDMAEAAMSTFVLLFALFCLFEGNHLNKFFRVSQEDEIVANPIGFDVLRGAFSLRLREYA